MQKPFVYDRIIEAGDICNYRDEISRLSVHVEKGDCVRLYGMRNFGKTSILRNVVGAQWQAKNPAKRIFIYIDFYSIQSLEDISQEVAKAFNKSMSGNSNLIDKTKDWLGSLKNIRPTWTPLNDDFGQFSFKMVSGQSPEFDVILDNINRLNLDDKFQFFIVFDEFQEIAKIPKAAAKLRSSLQELSPTIPVVISGSKPHMLQRVFDDPRAPFHAWGFTVELHYIDYQIYHRYILDRFEPAGKSMGIEASRHLQDRMGRIPEAINRLCEFLRVDSKISEITKDAVDLKIKEYVELARSNYTSQLARFTQKENAVLAAMAKHGKLRSVTSTAFLRDAGISKSGVSAIIERLLDESIIQKIWDGSDTPYISIADPLLSAFIAENQHT